MLDIKIPLRLLVIARSARMLVRMAVDAGFIPVAIDCFADSDTRRLALDTLKVATLTLADIRPAVERMRKAHGLTHVVYGSGFENCTESLAFLESDWIVLGNSVDVFKRFQNKRAFFEQLAVLGICYPETVFTPPVDGGRSWLVKPMRGEGGAGIACLRADSGVSVNDCYWQRYLEGEALSVLFAASRGSVNILGFNRQWTAKLDGDHRFVFAGVISHAEVSVANKSLLSEWLTKLAEVYPLLGLGSLDFILSADRCYVLEINARIPASAQLYGRSIFTRHLQACLGDLDDGFPEQALPSAYRIIYAQDAVTIQDDIAWPRWAVDRPECGAIIGKGQPICSIIAAGKSPRQVSELLRRRRQIIENILNTGR